jgi:hypothetical protein
MNLVLVRGLIVCGAVLLAAQLFLVLLSPSTVRAQGGFPTFNESLVQCGTSGEVYECFDPNNPGGVRYVVDDECSVCHFVALGQRIINFMIFLSVVGATLLFVYAGLLYMTAQGNSGQVGRAHGVFKNVLIGLVVVLAGWLIVDVVMKTLYDEGGTGWGPWNAIICNGATVSAQSNPLCRLYEPSIGEEPIGGGPGGPPVGPGGPPGSTADPNGGIARTGCDQIQDSAAQAKCATEANVESFLESGGVSVNKGFCVPGTAFSDTAANPSGCTDVGGLSPQTQQSIVQHASQCRSAGGIGTGCDFVVTGGSELGHSGSGPGTHAGGDKFDARHTQTLDAYVNGERFTTGTCSDGRSGRVHGQSGSCWVDEGDHWDVLTNG